MNINAFKFRMQTSSDMVFPTEYVEMSWMWTADKVLS